MQGREFFGVKLKQLIASSVTLAINEQSTNKLDDGSNAIHCHRIG
jgi:hypothetical protein